MENVFAFRDELIADYSTFSRSFSRIDAIDIREEVERQYAAGRYWPEPLIQINPNYQRKGSVQQLAADGVLHPLCAEIFQVSKESNPQPLHLYTHQLQAIAKAAQGQSYVVTTGTGSGKSLSFFIPIIDRILKSRDSDATPRTRAIVIYPMNALANSQLEELNKFLSGFPAGQQPFSVARYTGQEKTEERARIASNPPDILLTNFMMLELILTRYEDVDRRVVEHCSGLEFLVLDELHTYRGRQGADVALLVRRLRERLSARNLVCIGTSATMSSTGTQADRNQTVSAVASKLFGTRITPNDVVGETLERVTDPSRDVAAVKPLLPAAIERSRFEWADFPAFSKDPLAIWVELNLGIELPADEAPRRAAPMTLAEASKRLANDAGCTPDDAREALRHFLVAAHEVRTPQHRPPFAFRLHQFISGPGKVLATLEAPTTRHITLDAQRYAPGRQAESVKLYPVHFCRDCGQEYHPVWRSSTPEDRFDPREIDDITAGDDEDTRFGFLCPVRENQVYRGLLEDLPEAWLDLSRSEPRVKPAYQRAVPVRITVDPAGSLGKGESYWFAAGKFRFCLSCGQVHETHGKDQNRLASLSGEGRSSATTILTLSALRQLFAMRDLPEGLPDPRKMLGFTDNRQDAALQAGHFNDFVFLLTIRSGLIGALQERGGLLTEEVLAEAAFRALGFHSTDVSTLAEYLRTPTLAGLRRQDAQKWLRFVIGYRLLRDLRRGWRFNNPNLDQLNLVEIGYRSLDDFCGDESAFGRHPMLAALSLQGRQDLCRLVFDTMRRSLCLESRYLDAVEQDKARTGAFAYLNERWSFGADENLESARYLILGKRPQDRGQPRNDLVSGGARSRLLRQLKNAAFWKTACAAPPPVAWKDEEAIEILRALLISAAEHGYINRCPIDSSLEGWRLNAAALEWRLLADEQSASSNVFFRELYLAIAALLRQPQHPLFDFEAAEHTAQVDATRRQLLEARFRFTDKDRQDWAQTPGHEAPLERLPLMFCSPTMELGVDISALNTVYLRNVPPTPANYAQRSGRAGRSGQQALVITYCAALSPHDQWFFHHATQMVHGVVKPPTLDLANRELVESHLHAVWLANARVELEQSISPLLQLEEPSKPLKQELLQKLRDPAVSENALAAATRVIEQLPDLPSIDWYRPGFAEGVISEAAKRFDEALDRWRALFDATRTQMNMADQIVRSHTATQAERQNAQRRYADAARQYAILLKTGNTQNTDFYTYRYLASQGFLPGYNFPRLPLMAWIPARGGKGNNGADDEGSMVSRPRFLALSEFGPRSLIYHQGQMYRVVRAKLNVGYADHLTGNAALATITSRICGECGYGHLGDPGGAEPVANRCEGCDALLTDQDWVRELYRIETVETVPVERISINDEDRQRQGFELQTTYRFLPGPDGLVQRHDATVQDAGETLAGITYAPAARLWRINRGWRRRKDKNQLGFYINPITGTWSKKDDPDASDGKDTEDPLLDKVPNQRIVPFVEDHRNIMILSPVRPLPPEAMATLQAALRRGVEMTFQIEESELVAEPLPKVDDRRALLFYEAAEGGAGVLTRLALESRGISDVAAAALELMHYRRPEGKWRVEDLTDLEHKDAKGNSVCEAGCYQCLLSYFNQPDHPLIDRRQPDALALLVALANAEVIPTERAASGVTATPHGAVTSWLQALQAKGLRQPDALAVPVLQGALTADAQYRAARALVFLTPVSQDLRTSLADKGWQALDFSDTGRWTALFEEHAGVFLPAGGQA
jgi:Lhr-like helicase